MRVIVIILFSILNIMELFSQGRQGDREAYAAGRFYSADKSTLTKDISGSLLIVKNYRK